MTPAVLELRGVTCRYGGLVAADDVSFGVGAAEVVGLIGPNGAGKTTVINAITGLQPLAAGQVALAGSRLDGIRPHRRVLRGMARSFQLVRLTADLTVEENVILGLHAEPAYGVVSSVIGGPWRRAGERRLRQAARAALEQLGVLRYAEAMPDQIPYGAQRRVELARILVRSPSLVLLDEPTAGMPEAELGAFGETIRDIARRGGAVLVVEHNLSFIRAVCDRVVVLVEGRVLAEGEPAEVLERASVRESYLGLAS